MKSVIVGTAGHIDHGKTALVKALTGIDADRLAEEKRRGITIDLGFAHLELPGPDGKRLRLGFVDVPGHERFVRNMLAGVGGIDLVLLVIAADESIKPQTREHLDILQLIGIRRGITVLTKSDAVDAETLEVVRLEVEEFLRGSFLEPPESPIIPVSSLSGAGLDQLKRTLAQVSAEVPAKDSNALARLPIDRVFVIKGFGTVVTGTLISGTVCKDDELEVLPSGRKVRVRGVQVHGQNTERARAGQRTALNLVGASVEDLARGMTLAPPSTLSATRRVDVRLHLLESAPRALKSRARVHFHSNTMETRAALKPYGDPQVAPGETRYARLALNEAALLVPGDRFIIRQFSPVVTIGGGVVLDAAAPKRATGRDDFLRVLDRGAPEEALLARIARQRANGITMSALIAETGKTQESILRLLESEVKLGRAVEIADSFVEAAALTQITKELLEIVSEFHKANPLVNGIGREELRERGRMRGEIFAAILNRLAQSKHIEVAGDLVRLPGRSVVMKDDEAESKRKIEDAFSMSGLRVPALQEVLSGLKVDKSRAQKLVTLLLRDRVLIKVSDELVFHRSALEDLKRLIAAHKQRSPKIDVAGFKELTGVSRKYAIPLLEYLDRERITKRVGDTREVL
jgi:selenocysteine-specific elongation factor